MSLKVRWRVVVVGCDVIASFCVLFIEWCLRVSPTDSNAENDFNAEYQLEINCGKNVENL